MSHEKRIQQLLEEILDSDRTPEECCSNDSELLPEVRARWERIRRVEYQIDELFPSSSERFDSSGNASDSDFKLPCIPGYDVESVLGRGGMGVVFKARHHKLNRFVALKMLLAGAYAGQQELKRFRLEAESAAALRHPNIVQVHDVGDMSGPPYITLELVEGGSLAQRLSGIPQPAHKAAELVAQIAGAVQFAHQSGIIHRDLKPANILLTADGTPKIADFGLARSIERGREFTQTGARIGTPSYMAPEQALGKVGDIGPGADIYALGAILFEMLTGRPPFLADTAAEIERRVIGEEAPRPSRFNSRIPHDIETICLKCLQKTPARRYSSAQDLADDLHRFLDGKPVLARPVGKIERAIKWARRRPAWAITVSGVFLATVIGTVTAIWLHQREQAQHLERGLREGRARQAIESALAQVYTSGKAERWQEAKLILAEATNHLLNANSQELQDQISQSQSDLKFAEELEHIRQTAVISVLKRFGQTESFFPQLAQETQTAFLRAGFNLLGKPEDVASQILSKRFSEQILTALDEWAFAAFMDKQLALTERLLKVATIVDPDPAWRNQVRNTETWKNGSALRSLADKASISLTPAAAHHLAMLGSLLRNAGEKSTQTQLLQQALRRRPGDFWLNWEMAGALARDNKPAQALSYFRVVVALRPGNPWAINHLGTCLGNMGDYDEAIIQFRHAMELAPENAALSHNLFVALFQKGLMQEAQAEAQRAMVAFPDAHWAPQSLGKFFLEQNRPEKAIPYILKGIQRERVSWQGNFNLGQALVAIGKHEEALLAFRKSIEADSRQLGPRYSLGQTSLKLGKHKEAVQEFEWLIQKLNPENNKVDATAPAKPAPIEYANSRISLPVALLGWGQFGNAVIAAKQALELPRLKESQRSVLRRQLEIGRQLVPFEALLQGVVEQTAPDMKVNDLLAVAEWAALYKNRPVAAVRIYEHVFAKDPSLVANPEVRNRLNGVLAAVGAASGAGEDATGLSEREKSALRNTAFKWVRADLELFKRRYQLGQFSEQQQATQAIREWQQNNGLANVRDPAAVKKLPADEQANWQQFWREANSFAEQDPATSLILARAAVSRKEWDKAAEIYATIIQNTKQLDGEVRFEFAAVQLLKGDLPGYRQSCQQMLELAKTPVNCRPFLAARAVTLAADSVPNFAIPAQLASGELKRSENAFWSLREQGALSYRTSQYAEAIPQFERSLLEESRPGAAVVNWLWLAMACHQQRDAQEAERWLTKAESWLSSYPKEMPENALILELHYHNWLEAHILLNEARQLIRPL